MSDRDHRTEAPLPGTDPSEGDTIRCGTRLSQCFTGSVPDGTPVPGEPVPNRGSQPAGGPAARKKGALHRLQEALRDWFSGPESRSPLCCRARYSFDTLLGRKQALHRPARLITGGVPCGWRHKLETEELEAWHRWRADTLAGHSPGFIECGVPGCAGLECEDPAHWTYVEGSA